jgi:hypothetical protein
MRTHAWLWVCTLSLGVMGCATLKVVDGQKVNESVWLEDSATIQKQASLDLGCPADQVNLTLVEAGGGRATNVGARCGERKSRYVRVKTIWARQD